MEIGIVEIGAGADISSGEIQKIYRQFRMDTEAEMRLNLKRAVRVSHVPGPTAAPRLHRATNLAPQLRRV